MKNVAEKRPALVQLNRRKLLGKMIHQFLAETFTLDVWYERSTTSHNFLRKSMTIPVEC